MDKVLVTINYFIREKYWCSIRQLCDDELRKGQDPVLIFWKSFGIFKEGNTTEALRELTRVQDRREITLAAGIALIHYHERCRNVDQEAIDTLTLELDNREEMASDKDLYVAATFLYHINQFKRAGVYTQKILDNTGGGNQNSICLKGWIYLSTPKEENQKKSQQFFEGALNAGDGGHQKHLESMLGKAKLFEKLKQYDAALETLNEVSIQNKDFFPSLLEKTKIHMVNGDWEQALETVQKVLVKDRQNVEALRIYSFYLLTRENDIEYVLEKLDELIMAMKFNEAKNADLFYNMSRLFARYCGRRDTVLEKTLQMLEEATILQPENADYHSEIAHQKCMLGEYNTAYTIYQKASSFDETNQTPLYGMIYCKIKQDQLEDAGQQLEFLIEISETPDKKSSDHAYLEAIICWRQKQDKAAAIKLLDQALNLHITQTKTSQSNIDFYIRLSADFLLQLAQEYLLHCGTKPITSSQSTPKHLVKATKLLENVTKQNQGLTEAQVLLAKSKWLANDQASALKELKDCLEKDATMVEAHILSALINSEAGNMKAADHNLQQAFAQDFSIRENPVFMLMRSDVEIRGKDWEAALKTLEAAFALPQVQDPTNVPENSGAKKYSLPYGQAERARIFMNLIQCYCEVKNYEKAKKLMSRSISEFQGTPEEVKVMLAQSDMAIKMGDVKKGLAMLKKIQPDNQCFVEAKKKQAQLYLDELKDRNNYQRCYMEILDADNSIENLKLTGEALMDIQEPEEAIQFYEQALKKDPDDLVLVREVGRALVMTHDYNRAIRYYENTLRDDPKLFDLRNDLAELYIKLKAYDDSKRVLIDALKSIKDYKPDLDIKQKNVMTLMLLQKVYLEEDMQSPDWKFKENESAKQTLIQANKTQADVIQLCQEIGPDKLDDAKELAADILYKLGMYYEERDGSNEHALQNFNDALKKNNQHLKAMVAIARIAQNSGDNDQCMAYCQKIIQIEPSNEEATYMLANLMLFRDQSDQAIDTYIKLLEKDPDNFRILSNLIILLMRAGKIKDAQKFIEKAELKTQRSKMAGLHYCKGLFNRYNSEPQKALRDLNFARFDNFYGSFAITNMIEIYLNPANDLIYSSILETDYSTTSDNISAAKSLIKELNLKGTDTSILECQILIASKEKTSLEAAAKQLKLILQKNSQYVPGNVVMGLCLFLLKKSSDAKNYLKTVVKNDYQVQYAEFFEQAWILHADYFISQNKYDLAEAELKKALKYNKSAIKAEELMGLIKEKEKAYVDAADHYKRAFEMSNKKNGGVGYRLAFNYLKANRFVDAIDVGKEVLKINPAYPKLQSDIIDKARIALRA